MAAGPIPTPPDRALIAAIVVQHGGIRPALKALDAAGIHIGRGTFDGQLRGQASKLAKATTDKLNAYMAQLTPAERKDLRDDRRRIVSETGNDPRRIARTAKQEAEETRKNPETRKVRLTKFRRDLRAEQKRAKGSKQQPELPNDVGGGGGGGTGAPGGDNEYPDDLLDEYDEWSLGQDQTDIDEAPWVDQDDVPF